MRKFLPALLFIALMVSSVTAQDNRLNIVASHSILGDVVRNVVGDVADIAVTMPIGADPHAFEPVPSDVVALANADVVFINGALFEEGLLQAIENAGADMNIVVASSCVEILRFEDEDDTHDHESNNVSDIADLCEQHSNEIDGSDAVDHAHGYLYEEDCGEGDHTGDEHNHGACDPHVWMNPHNVMYWTLMIRDTLIEADPANAEIYTANASNYLAELDTLTNDFITPMVDSVPADNRILITSHDTLGYFADAYGFEIITTIIPGGSTLAEPSASDVAGVIDLVNQNGVPAIFGETTVSDAVAQTISAETGAELYVLYSGSLGDNDSPANTYIDYMRYNVMTIVEALGGGM